MDESNNCLEILLNLIHLARHSSSDAAAVAAYLADAETQAMRLAAIHGDETLTQAREVHEYGETSENHFDRE